MDPNIRVYGAVWCHDTTKTRTHLEENGRKFEFIEVDSDPDAEAKVLEWGEGKRRIPVVEIHGGRGTRRLVEPSNDQLDAALREAA